MTPCGDAPASQPAERRPRTEHWTQPAASQRLRLRTAADREALVRTAAGRWQCRQQSGEDGLGAGAGGGGSGEGDRCSLHEVWAPHL